MKKILGYLKPYTVFLLIVVILIFVQAMGNLKLPDYMASIVNIGIQSNGIEDITPKAISKDALEYLENFMEPKDKNIVEESYILIESNSKTSEVQKYVEEYPLLKESDIYVLDENIVNNKERMKELDYIFMVTDETFITILSSIQLPSAVGNSTGASTSTATATEKTNSEEVEFNLQSMYQIMPLVLNTMTPELLENSINSAKLMGETMLSQVALTFTKTFYSEVGLKISDIQTKYMIKIGATMIVTTLIIIVSSIIVGLIASRIAAGVARSLRKDVFEKVQKFSDKEFDKISTASLITRTTNDITQVQSVVFTIIRIVLFSLIMMVGAIIMITQTAKTMLWVLVLGFVAILVLIGLALVISMPKFKIFQNLIDKLNLISRENLSGIMVIRAFNTQKHEEKRFDKANFELADTMFFVDKVMSFMMPAMTILMNLLILLIVWVGADKIAASELQVGNMMAAIQYTMQVLMSFLMISMLFIMFPRALVSLKRIMEVLDMKISIDDPKMPQKFDKEKIGYVEFKNVSFKYDDANEDVIENINFVAKPGETTAIVGATGSGKSTIVKLMLRFYDVTSGEILVNGINVKDSTLHDLHDQIGYMPQKATLLSGTIESNLKYGNENATTEQVERCVKVSQAKDFIEEKENKYLDKISQSGANISGGQKQRLSIARALIKDTPIYVFDDTFSALDFKTDANLRKELKENFKEATKIIVAQRINTVMDAEQIIVLEEGKIVGKGTHQELMENCTVYRDIAASQLGNFDE